MSAKIQDQDHMDKKKTSTDKKYPKKILVERRNVAVLCGEFVAAAAHNYSVLSLFEGSVLKLGVPLEGRGLPVLRRKRRRNIGSSRRIAIKHTTAVATRHQQTLKHAGSLSPSGRGNARLRSVQCVIIGSRYRGLDHGALSLKVSISFISRLG